MPASPASRAPDTRSMELSSRPRRGVSVSTEEPLRSLREQHPKSIDAQRGPEGHVNQVQYGDHDRQDARPRPELQQSDPGNQPGQRNRQQNEKDNGADAAQDGNRNVRVAGVVGGAD